MRMKVGWLVVAPALRAFAVVTCLALLLVVGNITLHLRAYQDFDGRNAPQGRLV